MTSQKKNDEDLQAFIENAARVSRRKIMNEQEKREKHPNLMKLDSLLERFESWMIRKLHADRSQIKRVGHCAFCGEWCRGTLADGFVHDDGEVGCHNIDEQAIPRQVHLENKQLEAKDELRRMNPHD